MAGTKADSFAVERSTSIKAPPEKIFALINDFHGWESWSPWVKLDPAMKTTYSGAASGPGAVYQWVGNSDVGEGSDGNHSEAHGRVRQHGLHDRW